MRIAIIDAGRDETYGRARIRAALQERGVDVPVIHPSDVMFHFNSQRGAAFLGDLDLGGLDACLIRRTRAAVSETVDLVTFLTHAGVPCVDPLEAYASPLTKTGTMMRAAGHVAIPKTVILSALPADLHKIGTPLPCIVKPLAGFGGQNVCLANTWNELAGAIDRLLQSGERAMVQEHLHIRNEYRIVVVGSDVIARCSKTPADPAAIVRNYKQGAAFSLIERTNLDATAVEAAQRNHAVICGVDLAETDEGVYLLEANRSPSFEGVEKCGVDVAGPIARYMIHTVENAHPGGKKNGEG